MVILQGVLKKIDAQQKESPCLFSAGTLKSGIHIYDIRKPPHTFCTQGLWGVLGFCVLTKTFKGYYRSLSSSAVISSAVLMTLVPAE